MAGRFSTQIFGIGRCLQTNNNNDALRLVEKHNDKDIENNERTLNQLSMKANPGILNKVTEKQSEDVVINDKSGRTRASCKERDRVRCGGESDPKVTVMAGGPTQQIPVTGETQKTMRSKGQAKYVRFEKGAKDTDGTEKSRRRLRRNAGNDNVDPDEDSVQCSHFWKRVRKILRKHIGRVVRLIGMGAEVSPPMPGSTYIRVRTQQMNSFQDHHINSPSSYGMLLF